MFTSARLRLTAWYLLIIMSVSIFFSLGIYRLLMNEFTRFEQAQRFRFERRLEEEGFVPPGYKLRLLKEHLPMNLELIEETKKRVIIMLVSINSGIFIISGMLGYVLAGRTLQPIKEMMDEQNRFISDASHEFRTPLTSLKSAFEVYLRDKTPTLKEAKTVISESIGEVNKLQELAESLLLLAQFEKPNGHISFKKVQLHHIIAEAIHRVTLKAQEKHITIAYDKTNLEVEGNADGLIDVLIILLDNAIKYSPAKSTIQVDVSKTDGHIKTQIIDEGIGIEEEDIPHIFDRFYRADSARSRKSAGGYGLGLSIAKKIVDAHKGSMQAMQNESKGATFIVELPRKQPKGITKPSFFS